MIKKDMNGFVSASVEYQELPDGYLPFELEIDRVYRAYRTCYSKEPWKQKELSTTDHNNLLMAYRDQLTASSMIDKHESEDLVAAKVNKRITEYLEEFGADRLCQWLYKCKFIWDHKNHMSPLEHATLTVTLSDLSRSASHQVVRHRICSFSQASQRYISEEDPPMQVPPSIEDNPEAMKIYAQYLNQIPNAIEALKALNIPKEDIRYIFPNATKTRIVMTANWREWTHILGERTCSRAQWELRNICTLIYEYLIDQVPFVFDDVAPKCHRTRYCYEGKACQRFSGRFPERIYDTLEEVK